MQTDTEISKRYYQTKEESLLQIFEAYLMGKKKVHQVVPSVADDAYGPSYLKG